MLHCLPSSFGPYGCHLGYQNGRILAILNLYHCDASHQVLDQSNLQFGRRYLKNGWWPSCISERNDFCNSESLCRPDYSHQVSAQFDLWFGRCRLKNFKMAAAMAAILDIGTEQF